MANVLPFHYDVPQRCGAAIYSIGQSATLKCIRCTGPKTLANQSGWTSCRPWRMSQQPEFTSTTVPPNPAPAPGVTMSSDESVPPGHEPVSSPAQQRIPHWLMRTELYLRVLLRMYIGLAICYAPWSQLFWDQNPLFVQFPTLAIYAANGAVRGIISGLGLLNIWIALQDAIRHRNE